MDQNTTNASVQKLVNPTPEADASAAAAAASNVTRTDPSLLHQIAQLQAEKQALLTERREMDEKLKASLQEKEEKDKILESEREKHQQEKAEFVQVHAQEMQKMKEDFMNEWMETLSKKSPETIEKIRTGVDKLIENGLRKDKMWELFCAASQAHKDNVNTIEELQKTNSLLSDKNKELEEQIRVSSGFISEDSRLGKRVRQNDVSNSGPVPPVSDNATSSTIGNNNALGETDVWGHFESFMQQNTARGF